CPLVCASPRLPSGSLVSQPRGVSPRRSSSLAGFVVVRSRDPMWALQIHNSNSGCRRSIAVIFTVGLVVLVLVGNQIIDCEAIMAGDEVHALLGFPLLMCKDLWASKETVRYQANASRFAAEEASKII